MERLCSLLLGAAVVLGFLGMAAGVVALLTPPPQDDLGGRVVLDAGTNVPSSPAAVPSSGAPGDDDSRSNDDSPGDDDSREGTGSSGDDSPTSVPVNPPVVVDDDRDDD